MSAKKVRTKAALVRKSKPKKGKLIIIEGNEGSGKTTQVAKLEQYLRRNKIPYKTIDFPRYYDSFFGKFLAGFFRGEYGKFSEASPYLLTFPFALDRLHAAPKMNEWLDKGYHVIANRYVPTNLAHQSGRLAKKEKEKFVAWANELEYKIHKLPKENLVIFLHVPYKHSLKLMENRNRKNRAYTKGKAKDIAESDVNYVKNSEKAFLDLMNNYNHWVKIECVKNGVLRSIDDIHNEVTQILKNKNYV